MGGGKRRSTPLQHRGAFHGVGDFSRIGRLNSPGEWFGRAARTQLNAAVCGWLDRTSRQRAESGGTRAGSSLSLFGLAFYMLVITGAFAVRSAAGFGAVLIALPMLAFVLPVPTAVSVTTALTAITSIHHVSREWHRVAWRHFAIMAFYSAIGIGVGFYFIHLLDEDALRRSFFIPYMRWRQRRRRLCCPYAGAEP